MRKHFILKLFWMFLQAHLTHFSPQVLTRIIIFLLVHKYDITAFICRVNFILTVPTNIKRYDFLKFNLFSKIRQILCSENAFLL
eukprot:UN20683